MTELIVNHLGTEYLAEPCKIEEVSTDPYNFRVRLTGVENGWSMLFAVVNLSEGHSVMRNLKGALAENFNVYSAEDTVGKVALLLKDLSGKIVGITSMSTYFYKEPVFRDPLGV
jgi:hypothetical protein